MQAYKLLDESSLGFQMVHNICVDQGTQDLRGFEKHARAEGNRMGFEDYKPYLVFVHKEDIDESLEGEEVVVELEDCVPPENCRFPGKGIFHRLGVVDTFCPYS
jgi:hypothetical protein